MNVHLGVEIILTAADKCQTPNCSYHQKPITGRRRDYAAFLYTRRRGVLPVRVTTLYCRGESSSRCHTTYRPNYRVRDASSDHAVRVYDEGIPPVLEVAEHAYVEKELVELFRAQMCFAHASGETCARIYNMGLAGDMQSRPLTGDTVWHAFYLHALLQDRSRFGERLEVPHSGLHSDRFAAALEARNRAMVGDGQEFWAHACDECEQIIRAKPDDPDQRNSRIHACVMDGVTVSHPRCNRPHCVIPLASPRHRFCPDHAEYDRKCAVEDCGLPVSPGLRTCDTPAHRACEVEKREKGRAIFQLKQRMHRRSSTSKGVVPPKRVKTYLTRKWTHNEQLLVRPCGIVVSRATFYEAESPSNAAKFLLAAFPKHLPRCRPSYLFYDNNCKLLAHLRASGEDWADDVAFPVDVFHAANKHSETDDFCQRHCNPARFRELYNELHEWLFNSSVCEQTNAWFVKFLPVVREMLRVNYTFFLDEMIAIYNSYRVTVLLKRGKNPRLVPTSELSKPRERCSYV
ncbi:hypothetical protein C8Q76DRAFT_604520 [Earliella scabrosa]|nr:hypothetical protein C8Q76DRAFT_604520 [Earliella scabrosa]